MNTSDHQRLDASGSRTAWIMAGIIAGMSIPLGIWLMSDPMRFWTDFLDIGPELTHIPLGWVLAAVVTAGYVVYTFWAVPYVRRNAFRLDGLKALAVPLAMLSGTLEELVFRKLLMDWLAGIGTHWALQIAASAVVFGAAHSVWVAFSRDARIIIPTVLSTAGLGAGLAVVYLASDRLILPAILAHIAINLIIEPALLRSAVSGAWDEDPRSSHAGAAGA